MVKELIPIVIAAACSVGQALDRPYSPVQMRQWIGSSGNRLSHIQKRVRHAPTQMSVLLWSQPQFLYYRNTSSGGSKRASWRPISQSSLIFCRKPQRCSRGHAEFPRSCGSCYSVPSIGPRPPGDVGSALFWEWPSPVDTENLPSRHPEFHSVLLSGRG